MEFKVFSLNCWGLFLVSKNRYERMQAIATALAKSKYDVVCLQEVWLNSDYELIKDKISKVYPYSFYFYSGVTGSGVCIFSAHPIEQVLFHQWPVNGYIHKIHHGDWFGGKGVGFCKLNVHDYTVNVYTAHLHAEYCRENDEYQAHRVLQAFDTAQFIQMTSGDADLVVLAGDLNTEPGDLAYRLILSVPGFADAFVEAGDENLGNFATNENLSNSYTPLSLIRRNIQGKRIDYIMYSPGSSVDVYLKKYQMPWPHKVPGYDFDFSDHEAISASLIVKKRDIKAVKFDSQRKKAVLEESIEICDEALRNLNNHCYLYWFYTFVLFILLVTILTSGPPFGLKFIKHIFTVVTTVFMFYTLIMATLWNKIEKHAILAGKLSMWLSLKIVKSRDMM